MPKGSFKNRRFGSHRRVQQPGFLPTDVQALTGWWDFSDASTLWEDTSATNPVTNQGDSIARIDDKSSSGASLTQATGSAQPTWNVNTQNGRAAAEFDNANTQILFIGDHSNNFLTGGAGSLSVCTLFVVALTQTTGTYSMAGASTLSSNNEGAHMFQGNPSALRYRHGGSSPATEGGHSQNVWHYHTGRSGSATDRAIFTNGVSGGTDTTDIAIAANCDSFVIGGLTATSSPFDGEIGEVLIYDAVLSTPDQQNVENYLSRKWGI